LNPPNNLISFPASSVEGERQGLRRHSSDLNLSMGYNLSPETQLSINLKASITERASAITWLSQIHALGDKAHRVNMPAASATGVSQP
jgi:hypothetical protein